METPNERLDLLISKLNFSKNAFAEKIGVSSTALYRIIKGEIQLTDKMVYLIVGKNPTVNPNWLLTGEGEMFVNGPTSPAGQVSLSVSPTGGQVSLNNEAYINLKKENEFLKSQLDRAFQMLERLTQQPLGKLLGNWKKQVDTMKQVSIPVTPRLRNVA